MRRASAALREADLARHHGRVSNLIGLIIEATGLRAEVGEVCLIGADHNRSSVSAEVVGFRDGRTLLMPLGELHGIGPGTKVLGTGAPFRIAVGDGLLGRVIDGLGAPLDGAVAPLQEASRDNEPDPEFPRDSESDPLPRSWEHGDVEPSSKPSEHGEVDLLPQSSEHGDIDPFAATGLAPQHRGRSAPSLRSTVGGPPDALNRPRITERVGLGVRALDGLVPCGRGQRLGIFAGSGVGKSSLLGMIARSTSASVNVIALVGERGREVREFIERDLGDALGHSVVVVATSDQPALVRIKAALTATTIAEYFRDRGHDVMLMMDSVTRFAMAQREIGLTIGEPPATRGYTPSVFAMLPRLLERAGTSPNGSITALYTVLVDGDDMNEPIADAVRSILDGHVVLTRELAHAGHYPAIDILQSVSRLVGEIVPAEIVQAGQHLRAALACLRDKEDLITIGAYRSGTDPALDAALAHRLRIEAYLRQRVDEHSDPTSSDARLLALGASLEQATSEILNADEVLHTEVDDRPIDVQAEQGTPAIPALRLSL